MKPERQKVSLATGDALLVIDPQNDFLPGGSLAIECAHTVIPVFNRYLAEFARTRLPIFATREWHPEDHRSFLAQGGNWPAHCIANTKGAQFASDLILPPWTVVISKGLAPEREASSAFAETDLETRLQGYGIRRLFIGGLAIDHGVFHTVRDALVLGFRVCLLIDALRAVNLARGEADRAVAEMVHSGAVPITLEELDPSELAVREDYEI